MKDIIDFLKKEINNPFRNIFILSDKKRKALGLFLCFLKGNLSLKEFLLSLIPVNYRPPEISQKRINVINQKIADYLFKKDFLSPEGFIKLFSNNFYFLNLEDTLGLISELIIYDEYDAPKYIKENSIVFDIGANIGVFTIFTANLAKNGLVYAFEPVTDIFRILEKNTFFYKNIKIFKVGLGRENEKKKIFVRSWSPGDSTIDIDGTHRNSKSFDQVEEIEIITLDDFVDKNRINKIDFIKIDVEGYEFNVLKGGVNSLKKLKPIIAISLHSDKLKEEIIKFVETELKNLYKIELSTKNNNDIFLLPTP